MSVNRTPLAIDRAVLVDAGDGSGQVELYLRLDTKTWLVVLPAVEVDPAIPVDDIGRPQRVRRDSETTSAGVSGGL